MFATRTKSRAFDYDPSNRGYLPLYRERELNHCPGCGRSQWIVGRVSAECAFCATALPFAAPAISSPITSAANDWRSPPSLPAPVDLRARFRYP